MSEAAPQSPPPAPQGNRAIFWLSLLVFMAGLGYFAYSRYTRSDKFQASSELKRADGLVEKGEVVEAASLYRETALAFPGQSKEVISRFRKLIDEGLEKATLKQVQSVFEIAATWPDRPDLREGLVERGLELVKAKGDDDPRAAIEFSALLFALTEGDQKQQVKMIQEFAKLSEQWVKKHPDDVEVVTQYARVLEQRRDNEAVLKLLEPLREKLGSGDGAYLLARAYATSNRFDEALAILGPMCAERLPNLKKASTAFQALWTPAERKVLKSIEDRTAKEFDYGAYKEADPNLKNRIKSAYIDMQLRGDPDLVAAAKVRQRESRIADAVRLMADLTLSKARSSPLTDKLKDQLEAARIHLLVLKDILPREGDLYLLLGQIGYLKGDAKEGQKQMDALIERADRAPDALFQVGNLLWSLGEGAAGAKLVEEAYEKEKGDENKHAIALTRARMTEDVADVILWLGKADTSKGSVKVQLEQAKARQAGQKGLDKEAVGHHRNALDILEKEKESPEHLAEKARHWTAIFHLTGDREAMKKGLALFEQAVEKDKNNPAPLGATASQFLLAAAVDLVVDSIDASALKPRAELTHLNYLFADKAGRDEQIARVLKHPAIIRAREMATKAVEKLPRQARPYGVLNGLAFWTRDQKAMIELEKSLRTLDVDHAEAIPGSMARYAGKHDERLKKDRQTALTRWEKLVTLLREKKPDRTFAVALCGLVKTLLGGEKLGEPIDADRAVNLAQEARATSASKATSEVLVNALLYRAHEQLFAKVPEYKAMATRARRSLDSSDFVALALSREGPARAVAIKNPDVVRACTLLKERFEAFPDESMPWMFAMLEHTQPETAANVAKALKEDAFGAAARTVAIKLNPLALGPVLEEYWTLKLQDKEKEGLEKLKQLGKQGVPLPFEIP